MPATSADVTYILDLYGKCRANNALPVAGGMLDQPATIMDLFDVIDNVKDKYQKAKADKDRAQAELNGRYKS